MGASFRESKILELLNDHFHFLQLQAK